jgi:hypothetical protein
MMHANMIGNSLRAPVPHFQRSINLTYDAGNADYVRGYIPTPKGAETLATLLESTLSDTNQRAHVLHAAYGSGKSLLGVVLNAYASRDPQCQEAIAVVQERLERTFPEQAKRIDAYRNSRQRLLPVILCGNEGQLIPALTRALSRALVQHNISNLRLNTQFQAALDVISLWKTSYPDAHRQLETLVLDKQYSLEGFLERLQNLDNDALILFEQLYPEITAGAQFAHYVGSALDSLFHTTAKVLEDLEYTGILIIWDEFGRFLESTIGDAFGAEAAQLQSFAEFCNRSGKHQVHLVLITHRLISGYATGLPQSHQQEWARIAERFRTHDVSSDPNVTYRLIAEALGIPNKDDWSQFTEKYRSTFAELTARSLELSLFNELDDIVLRQNIVERSWPLHPLATYALPRLSSKVAQNERTLFTFLAADEPGTLTELLSHPRSASDWWLVQLDRLWDYFAGAIRSDTGDGGAHTIWSGAMYALSKTDANDFLSQALVKTLAILLIVGEANVQSKMILGQAIPTTDLLAWALSSSEDEIGMRLDILVQRRAVIYRRSDGYWTFTRGSDIDLDAELSAALDRHTPTRQQIRQILEKDFQLPAHLPRRYNQERHITRFFRSLYRWPDEIKSTCNDVFLKQLGNGYADGAVVYILTTNASEKEEAINILRNLPSGRIIYVLPDQPLLIMEPVRELFALYDLSNNSAFMQQDERLPREIAFFVEDVQRRLTRALQPLLEVHHFKSTWWWYEHDQWSSAHLSSEEATQLLSRLCNDWFKETPLINNELVNQHAPSGQQERAMEKVINVLLNYPPNALPRDFNLAGRGPDWLIVRTLLANTKLIHPTIGLFELKEPEASSSLALVWQIIQEFLDNAVEQEQDILHLIDKLQSPPFGLRRGVLPILLAAAFRSRLPVLTIRQNRRIISPLTGQIFVTICKAAEEYTLELSPWDVKRATLWSALEGCVKDFLTDQERIQQPLHTLSIGLLRWLQSQPRYCRDTTHVSQDAQQLRNLIRKAQRNPLEVLAHDLLELLDDGSCDLTSSESTYKGMFVKQLSHLMDEIATAYQTLLHSLDRLVGETFSIENADGHTVLYLWLESLEKDVGESLKGFRFGDRIAQMLVDLVYQEHTPQGRNFWDQLSRVVLGLPLVDWTDQSYESFKRNLLEARKRIEHAVFDISKGEEAVQLSVLLPTKNEQTYRFRQSGLSPQGQRILQNFKSTFDIAGRPLSLDEKRQIVIDLLDHVLGKKDSHG